MWKKLAIACLVLCSSVSVRGTCLTEQPSQRGKSVTNEDITEAILGYTLDQYKQMAFDPEYIKENIFTSPYSIWTALAVTYLGSRGSTEHDLARLLGLAGLDKSQVHDKMDALQKGLTRETDTFSVANLIAFDRIIQLKGCLSINPLLEIVSLDFQYDKLNSANRVNRWVSSVTNDKIKNVLNAQLLTSDTIMILLNAVYFKASWKYEFIREETVKDFFIVSPHEIREVDMMRLQTLLGYYRHRRLDVSAVELPYAGDKYSMILILPTDRDASINDLIDKMTSKDIHEISRGLRERSVTVSVPKTKIESKYNMNKVLSEMGVQSIFAGADLRGFIRAGPPLKIDDVVHQAYIDINEKGTEAAAASGVVTSTRGSHNAHVNLKFNRPHLFMIKDNENDVILFMGVVRQPQGTAYRSS